MFSFVLLVCAKVFFGASAPFFSGLLTVILVGGYLGLIVRCRLSVST